MVDEKENIPSDIKLIGEVIIELNTSHNNVTLYPRDHPLVENSLNNAFKALSKLLELRPDIALKILKDAIIVDNKPLNKKNTVYREVAERLFHANIGSLKFKRGLTKEELYLFHQTLSEYTERVNSGDTFQEVLKGNDVSNIETESFDYSAFSFKVGKTEKDSNEDIWEQYLRCLLDGTLAADTSSSDLMHEIAPDALKRLLNKALTGDMDEEAYDRIINTYLKKPFTAEEFIGFLEIVKGLREDIKERFLSSTVKTISEDIDSAEIAFKDLSLDKLADFLANLNEQKVALPEVFLKLIDKLTSLDKLDIRELPSGGTHLVDDIPLSPEASRLLRIRRTGQRNDIEYEEEISKILSSDYKAGPSNKPAEEIEKQFSDEYFDREFSQTMRDLSSSDIVTEEEYEYYIDILKQQTGQFIGTAQYGEVLKTIKMLDSNISKKLFTNITVKALEYYRSGEFAVQFVDSLRIRDMEARKDALLLCDYYGKDIIPLMIDALTKEESQTVRRFLLDLIIYFGREAVPDAIKNLEDERWYVKRNMLYILKECCEGENLSSVRPYCSHEDKKVSSEAIKCLLKFRDSYGVEMLRNNLNAKSWETVEQAIFLSGAFKVREVVPELIQILRKKSMSSKHVYSKIPIVKALGQIGDLRAQETLQGMLSISGFPFKKATDELKQVTSMTLKKLS